MAGEFGPSALATPANAVTVTRLVAAPLLLLLLLDQHTSWVAIAAWAILAGTDGVDGWLARRHGTTRSGAFLDPLADKFLVFAAMIALVAVGRFWWVPVAIIACREVGISLYRSVVARQGISVPARPLAKVKTWVQDLAVGAALLPLTERHHPGVAVALLYGAVVLTLLSGAQYLIDGRRGRLGQAADEPTSPLPRLGAEIDAAAARLVEAGAAPVLNRLVDADPAPTATPRPAHPAGA
jgi:CDP-diacylglycerol--glycerol-3-phosphate 3-phosphatidyltransferase